MEKLYENLLAKKEKIGIVGLGYVGYPQALAFAEKIKTIGYDTNIDKIKNYSKNVSGYLELTHDEKKLKEAKFIIVAVPTPINNHKKPDLRILKEASETVGRNLTKGAIVVYESTVYPGVTENICIPILEKTSGMKAGRDFKVGYSPERINPGDEVHTLENIVKIVSAIDEETRDVMAKIYELVIEKTHKVSSIKIAEAAKLSENAQRDINIAFMNELAMIFEKMDIHTHEVVEAMNTKWNALGFTPGLVGGHCISVDPYYFIYEAERLGYHSQIILSGRKINDQMPQFIVDTLIKKMLLADKDIKKSKIYILGLTFKEDCSDLRNSKSIEIIHLLKEYGIQPLAVDPYVDAEAIKKSDGIQLVDLEEVKDADSIIFTVAHKEFKALDLSKIDRLYKDINPDKKILLDLRNTFSKKKAEEIGLSYYSL